MVGLGFKIEMDCAHVLEVKFRSSLRQRRSFDERSVIGPLDSTRICDRISVRTSLGNAVMPVEQGRSVLDVSCEDDNDTFAML